MKVNMKVGELLRYCLAGHSAIVFTILIGGSQRTNHSAQYLYPQSNHSTRLVTTGGQQFYNERSIGGVLDHEFQFCLFILGGYYSLILQLPRKYLVYLFSNLFGCIESMQHLDPSHAIQRLHRLPKSTTYNKFKVIILFTELYRLFVHFINS